VLGAGVGVGVGVGAGVGVGVGVAMFCTAGAGRKTAGPTATFEVPADGWSGTDRPNPVDC
jgi:hypothetical protein